MSLPFILEREPEPHSSTHAIGFTPQQQRQLDAAMTYHALTNPGASLVFLVSIGELHQMPALTDRTTLTGEPHGRVICTLRARSTAVGTGASSSQPGDPETHAPHRIPIHLRLGHPNATPATTEPPQIFSLPRKIYRFLEKRTPVLLDTAREIITIRRESAISKPLPRFPDNQRAAEVVRVSQQWKHSPSSPHPGESPAILFGLHWLQTGGAERWAIKSIQLAKQSGFLPIVVTDQNSVHPWITRPELDNCIIISLSFDEHLHTVDIALIHALLENYDVRGIVLHHCQLLYEGLPWIKTHRPELPVIDSLHIVEYLGGGYPGISTEYDEFIDIHHVISPQLIRWLHEVQSVEQEKLVLAPLGSLTAGRIGVFQPRSPSRPFTISFIGRLSRQKRPDLFLSLVHKLRKNGMKFHAILQGDGELRDVVDQLIDRYKLRDVIEQRFEDTPVTDTLAVTDLLVITSINEGLTLTSFEAISAGVPVLSADVGSQYTLIEGDMLAPRPARRFLSHATRQILNLSESESLRMFTWNQQKSQMAKFSHHPTAELYFERLFATWKA